MASVGKARDPVCGMMVDPARAAATVVHDGQSYHFCSTGCARRFEAEPARFLSPKAGLPMSMGAAPASNQPTAVSSMPAAAAMEPPATGLQAYAPLATILLLLLSATLVLAWRDLRAGTFTAAGAVAHFMAGFFLVFAGFKLMDLPGFAQGYSTYDLLASKVPAYGFVYPFVELGFGLAMLADVGGKPLLVAEIVVMAFSGFGVAIKLARHEPFTCACLGTFLKVPLTKVTLVEDLGMAALAAALLFL